MFILYYTSGLSSEGSHQAHIESQQGSSAVNYRQQLNHFFQEKRILNPKYEFDSNCSSGSTRYRCTIRYTHNGEMKRVDSRRYYASRPAAKEEVARLVLLRENKTN